MVGQERGQRHLRGPVPGAGHTAAGLLLLGGFGGTPTPVWSLLVLLAVFPSSPQCRLPGNTTCQQNAMGLVGLHCSGSLLGISGWDLCSGSGRLQAGVGQCKGGQLPVPAPLPGAAGRAALLELEGWKKAGCSCWAELQDSGVEARLGFVWLQGVEQWPGTGSAPQALSAQRGPWAVTACLCVPAGTVQEGDLSMEQEGAELGS